MESKGESGWLLLIHQLPPKPAYFRVKIWRRLQRLGAVPIKNSVYVLPSSDQAREDFQWVLREIVEGGGEAMICDARFVGGLSDDQVIELFHTARDADYAQLALEARRLLDELPEGASLSGDRRAQAEAAFARLRRRHLEVVAIDPLASPGRAAVEEMLGSAESRLREPGGAARPSGGTAIDRAALRGRTWVTRRGVHVDRIACAWLIRRFVDPEARFKFVAPSGYRPESGELRFDMFEAEFTHEGGHCTFEVLLDKMSLNDDALRPIAEIVHDIDIKDARFERLEAPGIDRLIAGIAMAHPKDEARLERGASLFDDLYEYFRRKHA